MISAISMAFQALLANKLRAVLTVLGTVIGVACVVALWHIGESGRRYMSDSLASIGQNLIFVHPRYRGDEGADTRFRFRPLSLADAAAIRQSCPSVLEASPFLHSICESVYGPRTRRTQLYGCFASYLTMSNAVVERGTPFSDADVRNSARVALLGATVAHELFGSLDPLGETVRVNQVPFTVIGVLAAKGSLFGNDQDDRILAPFTTAATHLGWGRNIHTIFVSARERDLIPQAKNEILMAVRQSQKLRPEQKDSIELRDLGQLAKSVDSVLIGITMLLGAIGAISLLVGGIGIMNIMLVSVTERTREIGLRMALGATDFNVLMQFLVEAMVLSGLGGVIGIGGGTGLALGTTVVLSKVTEQPWHFQLSVPAVAVAFLFALAIGIFFGFYPAWRASRLDPIVALRHE